MTFKSVLATHPAQMLALVKKSDIKANIVALWNTPYDADPILEPEMVGLTYGQKILMEQVKMAARGDGAAVDRLLDRMIGKPEQINKNLNATMGYKDWLEQVAKEEGIIDADGRVVEDAEINPNQQTL